VRKLWESQGVKVSRLKRVRFGPLFIPSTITKGRFQELPRKDLDKLLKVAYPRVEKPKEAEPAPR